MATERALSSLMVSLVDEETRSRNRLLLRNFMDETRGRLGHDIPRDIPAQSDRVAVFVGWLEDDRLEYVFRNVLHFLGPGWGLQVIAWRSLMRNILEFTHDWSHVHYTTLDEPEPGPGVLDDMMTRPYFWAMLRGSHCLFFDADSILCSRGVERFMDYDYVGSPWAPGKSFSPYVRVGDGGLSLRRKTAMETIASENQRRNMISREDVFFALHTALNADRFRVPGFETARQFSVESDYFSTPIGMHRPWECLPTDKMRSLLDTIRY